LLTDARIAASKREIETNWTLDDVLDAHAALDVRDEAERRANAPPAKGGR